METQEGSCLPIEVGAILVRGSQLILRSVVHLLFVLLACTLCASTATKAEPIVSVSWSPAQIASGSPMLFRVQTAKAPGSVEATWQTHPLMFFPSNDHHVWYGLAGVDVESKPGTYKLEVVVTLPNGDVQRVTKDVIVERAKYKTEVLRVPQKYVKPDPETMVRIEADKALKKAAFAQEIPTAEWSGRFEVPVNTKPSEGFGTRRTFNGQLASIHRGMDYHAPMGTPVLAANAGQVILARELFYEGNCVIINHGQQFMTMYMHLSSLQVKEGEKVEKGQQIGLSGATGRVTGPHLHVAVRWQDAYLDPAQLWVLPLPKLEVKQAVVGAK